jgi:hypothetical protein
MFDPYRDWLDIPPDEQPPTHYRLLGIAPDEADAEAIKEAALRQTSRVRLFQVGPQAELCTRLLNEIAQARAVLANPKSRQEYDTRLKAPPEQQQTDNPPASTAAPSSPAAPSSRAATTWARPDRLLAALGYGFLLVIGFAISFCLTFQSVRTGRPAPAVNPQSPTAPQPGGQQP